MDFNQLWALEQGFWTGDAAFYEENLSPDCLMILPPPAGMLERAAAIESIAGARRWRAAEFFSQRHVAVSDDAAVLVYRVVAQRSAREAPYTALASSVYRLVAGIPMLAFHQQTPG